MGVSAYDIRVIVVARSKLVSLLLQRSLENHGLEFKFVGYARDCGAALKLAAEEKPDVAVVSLANAAEESDSLRVALQSLTRVLVCTGRRESDVDVIVHGASGVVHHDDSTDAFLSAIRTIRDGQLWLDEVSARRLFVNLCASRRRRPPFGPVTDRGRANNKRLRQRKNTGRASQRPS